MLFKYYITLLPYNLQAFFFQKFYFSFAIPLTDVSAAMI